MKWWQIRLLLYFFLHFLGKEVHFYWAKSAFFDLAKYWSNFILYNIKLENVILDHYSEKRQERSTLPQSV